MLARNFFSYVDNRSGAAAPNYTQEWGQGFIANFQSGYTQGTIGFGMDARCCLVESGGRIHRVFHDGVDDRQIPACWRNHMAGALRL